MTNEHKFTRAASAFEAYANELARSTYTDMDGTMTRLLTDLRHFAAEWKIDFDACSQAAKDQFENDIEEARD